MENKKDTKKENTQDIGWAIPKENYKFIIAGIILIVLGYILMAGGKSDDPKIFNPEVFSFRRITLAPMMVLAGFIFEIWAIMRKPKNEQ
ncbi:MAG: DUF3098 domain-containing protein [Bacteroidia bacterium]|nr:DUF3098 domain-containing protein [Bacteroidia bacterium]